MPPGKSCAASAESLALFAPTPSWALDDATRMRLQTLREAVQSRHKLRMRYHDVIGAPTQRVVRPLGCFYWGKVWTFSAWCELRAAFLGNPVVLASSAVLGRGPLRHDMTLSLQAVEHGIEHAVGPLQMPARQLRDPLDDGVAVAIAFGEDREHERGGGRSYQVLVHVHT